MDYTSFENKLTQDNPDDYVGKPVNMVSKTRDELIADMTGPGSILTDTESETVTKKYWKTIINYTADGNTYRDDYISTRLDISGVFDGPDDRFDPGRHSITISIVPGPALKEAVKQIRPRFVKPDPEQPEIKSIYDWGSDATNSKLTVGGAMEITGYALKVYSEQADQGVFFINKNSGEETKADRLRTNEPKKITLSVPRLAAGLYRLEIRNTTRNGKTLRVGMSTIELIVD